MKSRKKVAPSQKKKRTAFRLTDEEWQMIDDLQKKNPVLNTSQIIRQAIREKWQKEK